MLIKKMSKFLFCSGSQQHCCVSDSNALGQFWEVSGLTMVQAFTFAVSDRGMFRGKFSNFESMF